MATLHAKLNLIAREANRVLRARYIAPNVFFRGHEENFPNRNRGDTIEVTQPYEPPVHEWSGSGTTTANSPVEAKHNLTLEKHYYEQIQLTQKELTLELDQFNRRFTEPAMKQIAKECDKYILGKISDIPHYYATDAGTPANLTTDAHILAARKVLNANEVPMDRRVAVVGNDQEEDILKIANFIQADRRGDGGTAFERAMMGMAYGIDWFMDINTQQQGDGNRSTGWLVDDSTAANRAAGVTSIHIDSGSNNPEVGDVFTFAGQTTQHVVRSTFTGGEGDIGFYPALSANIADNAALTFVAQHTLGFIGDPMAISVAFAPLEPVVDNYGMSIDRETGISVLVQMDGSLSSLTRNIMWSVLVGAAATDPDRGVRLCMAA